MDATRISDGELVALKRIVKPDHPEEAEIATFLGTGSLLNDPLNHSVPLYEILHVPDEPDVIVLVMPYLRAYNDPPFQTVGELMEFFRQMFEAVQFLHKHHIAHRDPMILNWMMDPKPMYPEMFHPTETELSRDYKRDAKSYSRTRRPPRYILIDYGISCKYEAEDLPPRESPLKSGDRTAPEIQSYDVLYDPFPTDVYYLGNLIREHWIPRYQALNFLQPFITPLVQDDPAQRPTIHDVVTQFGLLLSSLSSWKLRQRLRKKTESSTGAFFRGIGHAFRTLNYIIQRLPALPTPNY